MEEVGANPFPPLTAVSALFEELQGELQSSPSSTAYDALTTTAARRVVGAVSASITTLGDGHFRTVSASDDAAVRADAIQYDVGSVLVRTPFDSTHVIGRWICAAMSAGLNMGLGWCAKSDSSACCPTDSTRGYLPSSC